MSWIKRRKAVVRKRTGQIGRDIDEWSRRKVSLTTPFLDVQPRHVSLSLSLAIMLHNLPVARWRWLRWSGRPPPPLPLNRPGLVVIGERGCWRTLWSLRSPRTGAACLYCRKKWATGKSHLLQPPPNTLIPSWTLLIALWTSPVSARFLLRAFSDSFTRGLI